MDNKAYGFVYITENLINHKKYIGQKTYDNNNKWVNYLGSGELLRKAIRKYGKNNFKREVLDTASNRDELNEKERYWINHYDAVNSVDFYNIAGGGTGGNTKIGYSEEEYAAAEAARIKAVIEGHRGMDGANAPQAKLTNEQALEIVSQLINGSFHSDLARKYNVSVSTINDIARHKTWRSLTEGVVFPDITRRRVGQRSAMKCSKPVVVYDKEMAYVGEYPSAREAERCLGVGYRLISQVCNGEKPTAHGYIFRFSDTSNT